MADRETYLRVPGDADINPEELELRLHNLAARSDLMYDGPESEGDWEVHAFGDIPPDDLVKLVRPALKPGKVSVTGERQITWEPLTPPPWIWPTGGAYDAYDRAVRKCCRRVGEDAELTVWWKSTGHSRLYFQQAGAAAALKNGHPWSFWPVDNGSLSVQAKVDLSVFDGRELARGQASRQARVNVLDVLTRTAEYLGKPLPLTSLLDGWKTNS